MKLPSVSILKNELATTNQGFIGKYKVFSVIKDEGDTKVIAGIYFKNLWFRRCIIKTSRVSSVASTNINKRLAWQFNIHQELCSNLPVAQALETFELNGKRYIVLDFIKGDDLQTTIDSIYGQRSFKQLGETKIKLVAWALDIVRTIKNMHALGYVHRDISASNFIVSKVGLYLVDLELAWNFHEKGMAFPGWTKGYSSPQQTRHALPSTSDDIYSLGCLIINLLTHVHPKNLPLRDLNRIAEVLSRHFEYADFLDLVLRCLDPVAKERPEITKIEEYLLRYGESIKKQMV